MHVNTFRADRACAWHTREVSCSVAHYPLYDNSRIRWGVMIQPHRHSHPGKHMYTHEHCMYTHTQVCIIMLSTMTIPSTTVHENYSGHCKCVGMYVYTCILRVYQAVSWDLCCSTPIHLVYFLLISGLLNASRKKMLQCWQQSTEYTSGGVPLYTHTSCPGTHTHTQCVCVSAAPALSSGMSLYLVDYTVPVHVPSFRHNTHSN